MKITQEIYTESGVNPGTVCLYIIFKVTTQVNFTMLDS